MAATLTNAGSLPSDDPLQRVLDPSPGETAEQRSARQSAEQLARQLSNEIDDYLKKDASRRKDIVKLLLLGQAESGKSTTLKNMKLVYATESFQKERASWGPIIHFNILRHVVRIIRIIEGEQERPRPSASSDNISRRQDLFDTEHRVMIMKLRPLVDIEQSMAKHLQQSLQQRAGEEVAVHSHFAWTKHFHRPPNHTHSSAGDSLKSEVSRVLNASCSDILRLWHDPQVRCLLHAQEINLEHEAGFFLDDLERVTAMNYEPSDLDVCKARLKTVGVTETHLKVRSHLGHGDWVVYDVGGSRTQRASWKPFFDDVRAIVFLAPLSAYNQTLEEMPSVNRLEDSLLLWRDISGSPLLARAHLILFLNKIDLLQKKLQQGIDFGSYLLGYTGSNDAEAVCKFMKKKFLAVNKDAQDKLKQSDRVPSRVVRVFLTSVLDLSSTRRIIIEVEDSILGGNLATSTMV